MPARIKHSQAADVSSVENVEKQMVENATKVVKEQKLKYISTGSTLLNLAVSGSANGGWPRGRVINVVGDGSSGKTLLALELCAMTRKLHPKAGIVYNNAEGVMDFGIDEMFYPGLEDSIEWINTETVEAFGKDIGNRLKKLKDKETLVYIVDSMDALTSDEELENFIKGDDQGGFHLAKQKYMSQFFRNLSGQVENRDCLLFIVSQIRDKIGVVFGKKQFRAGGKALDFYTHVVVWLYERGKMLKTSLGVKRPYGINVAARVERNKVAKPFREADLKILFDYGVDDIDTLVEWVYAGNDSNGYTWESTGKIYKQKDPFIKYLCDNGFEDELVTLAEKKWNQIEDKLLEVANSRKKKY